MRSRLEGGVDLSFVGTIAELIGFLRCLKSNVLLVLGLVLGFELHPKSVDQVEHSQLLTGGQDCAGCEEPARYYVGLENIGDTSRSFRDLLLYRYHGRLSVGPLLIRAGKTSGHSSDLGGGHDASSRISTRAVVRISLRQT